MSGENSKNITFLIFTFNEEKRIEYPVKSYLPYGDVLLVDNFSSDNTCEIARQLGARVIQRDNSRLPVAECKEEADFIFPHVKTEWIFWGFADEMVPESCLKVYRDIVDNATHKIVVQKLKTMLYHPDMEMLSAQAAIKLFKRGAIDFLPSGQSIHGLGRFAADIRSQDIRFLPPLDEYAVHHFSVYNTEKLTLNHNRYSTSHSGLMPGNNLGIKIFIQPFMTFLIFYFVHGGFKYGVRGFIAAVQYSYYLFQVLAKAYERHHHITLEGIEENFRKKKSEMLEKSPKSSWMTRVVAAVKVFVFSKLYLYKKRNSR